MPSLSINVNATQMGHLKGSTKWLQQRLTHPLPAAPADDLPEEECVGLPVLLVARRVQHEVHAACGKNGAEWAKVLNWVGSVRSVPQEMLTHT